MSRDPSVLPYDLHVGATAAAAPLVLDSPHSWPDWPADAPQPQAPAAALRTSCDAWVDRLWQQAADGRAPLLAARFHRAYIDANRARDDIDPALLDGPWPGPLNPGEKSRRGFGLLRRLALPQVPMYARPLAVADVQQRIERCYDPYHARLAALIATAQARHTQVLHLNCHSMKSVGNAMNDDDGQPRPDLVVSDLDGQSAGAPMRLLVVGLLAELGYRVQINDPYRGGELIRRHGAPAQGRHSLQIEINRALYMDEAGHRPSPGFDRLAADLHRFLGRLLQALAQGTGPPPAG